MYLSETQVGRWAALRSWDMSCGCCVLFIPFRRKRGSSTRSGNASGKRVLENFEIYPKRSLTVAFPRTRSRSSLVAGWSSLVARQAHNLKVVGSNPTPAPNLKSPRPKPRAVCCLRYGDSNPSACSRSGDPAAGRRPCTAFEAVQLPNRAFADSAEKCRTSPFLHSVESVAREIIHQNRIII